MSTIDRQVDIPVFTADEAAEFEADIAAAGGYWSAYDFDQPGVVNDIEQTFWSELRDRYVGQEFASPEDKEAAWNAYLSDARLYTTAIQIALLRHTLSKVPREDKF